MYKERRHMLKSTTSMAYGMIATAYKESQDGLITEQQAMNKAKEAVRVMRYDNGSGYLWIQDDTLPIPYMIMHPTVPGLEGKQGKNRLYYNALKNGNNLLAEFVEKSQKVPDGAFVGYQWPKPTVQGLTTIQPKLSHVRMFKPWGWVIGTGVYTDDIERENKAQRDQIRKKLFEKIAAVRIVKSGYFYIFDGKSNFLVHPTLKGTNGKTLKNPVTGSYVLNDLKNAAKHPNKPFEYAWAKPDDISDQAFKKVAIIRHFEPLDWYVGVSPYVDELAAPAKELSLKILFISLIFLFIGTLLSWWMARTISTPLTLLAKTSHQIGNKGLTNITLPIKGTIETKSLGHSLQNMVESLHKNQNQLQTISFLVESSASSIMMSDMKGKITYVNPAFLESWGYKNKKRF
jgi:signal transduction histidine kinase